MSDRIRREAERYRQEQAAKAAREAQQERDRIARENLERSVREAEERRRQGK